MLLAELETERCDSVSTLERPLSADCSPDSALCTLPSADTCALIGVSWVCSVAAGNWLAALACWISDWISLELRRDWTCDVMAMGWVHSSARLSRPRLMAGDGYHPTLSAGHTKVLIDGIDVSDPSAGDAFDF